MEDVRRHPDRAEAIARQLLVAMEDRAEDLDGLLYEAACTIRALLPPQGGTNG